MRHGYGEHLACMTRRDHDCRHGFGFPGLRWLERVPHLDPGVVGTLTARHEPDQVYDTYVRALSVELTEYPEHRHKRWLVDRSAAAALIDDRQASAALLGVSPEEQSRAQRLGSPTNQTPAAWGERDQTRARLAYHRLGGGFRAVVGWFE
jgi:hypothetical protein